MIDWLFWLLLHPQLLPGTPSHGLVPVAILAVAAVTAALTAAQLGYTLANRPHTRRLPIEDSISNSTNGAFIPIGYGTCRFAGQVIWSSGIKYVGQTEKKGGQPKYSASAAFAFGEGPGRITRIWGDSKFIWTSLPATASEVPINLFPAWNATTTYNPGNEVAYNGQIYVAFETNTGVIPAGSPRDSGGQVIWGQTGTFPQFDPTIVYNIGDVVVYGGQFWVNIQTSNSDAVHTVPPESTHWKLLTTYYPPPTIYQGTLTQNPDPLIQATEGVAVTSGNRGLIYVVFHNLPLQNFGNRIPNLRAEVTFYKTSNLL